ncbi:hypothetical protein Dsin_004712 [Dipteronia sinensis]|uniref:Uncharacterized protein n=1 Tax=Dipteronia sinensis TaxID=43782 RepID=A0AAE0AW33_9ROSI|nr:hypothetical protein Dsin_004712 [Dipteronia sinensis]
MSEESREVFTPSQSSGRRKGEHEGLVNPSQNKAGWERRQNVSKSRVGEKKAGSRVSRCPCQNQRHQSLPAGAENHNIDKDNQERESSSYAPDKEQGQLSIEPSLEESLQAHLNDLEAKFVRSKFGVDMGGQILIDSLKANTGAIEMSVIKGEKEKQSSRGYGRKKQYSTKKTGRKSKLGKKGDPKTHSDMERRNQMTVKNMMNKEEEIAKVIETGIALGFDFNSNIEEVKGILKAGVIDIALLGGVTFTCTNNRESASWARLDRFLVSPSLLVLFPNLTQKGLPKSVSDHNVITLGVSKVDWGPCPFRFYKTWLEDKDLMKSAMESWEGCKASGAVGWRIFSKLKAVKVKLKHLVTVKNKELALVEIYEKQLQEIDRIAMVVGWTEELRKVRMDTLSNLWKEIRREEQL